MLGVDAQTRIQPQGPNRQGNKPGRRQAGRLAFSRFKPQPYIQYQGTSISPSNLEFNIVFSSL